MWPTNLLLNHILAGKETQHEDPFEELEAGHENKGLEDGLNLRIARLIPPTSKFRGIVCPPRDIRSGSQTIVAVGDRVQDQRSAGGGQSDLQFELQAPPQPERSHAVHCFFIIKDRASYKYRTRGRIQIHYGNLGNPGSEQHLEVGLTSVHWEICALVVEV